MSLDDIKKNLGTILIGKNTVLDNIRQGRIAKVYLSKNIEASLKEDVEHLKTISGFEVEMLAINNDELGTLCKKPFSVSIIGVLK